MRNLTRLVVVALSILTALPTWAIPFSATLPDAVGPIRGTGGPVSYVIRGVNAPGQSADGAATLEFDLIGYGGIDGFGPRINTNDVYDDFSFRTGGTYFDIALNMGGANPGPALFLGSFPEVTLVSYTDTGPGQGGLAQFRVAFTLLSGDNSFVFQYGCCSPTNGTEEGWGLRNIVVTANLLTDQPPVPGIPEPTMLSLLMAGLIGIGVVLRRRRAAA